jgi:type IV pilus assembly protein PilA
MQRAGRGADDRAVREERGFTLIELLMVVTIIGILLAIAVPTYLGARERSEDRAVQSNLRTAFVASRIYFTQESAFTDSTGDMSEIEPTIQWQNDPLDESSDPNAVYVATDGDDVIVLGARTASGWCFFLRDIVGGLDGGTYYDGEAASDGTCAPPAPAQIDQPRWSGRVD